MTNTIHTDPVVYVMELLPHTVTIDVCKTFLKYLTQYELRDPHPLALNTAYLGVHKLTFFKTDENTILDIFIRNKTQLVYKVHLNLDAKKSQVTDTTSDEVILLRKKIQGLDELDETKKVRSDPFNFTLAVLLYKLCQQLRTSKDRIATDIYRTTSIGILVCLQYKFFSSLVHHRFPYGAKEEVMRTVIEGLNYKFAIIQYKTWKELIYQRAREFVLDTNSIHYPTMMSPTPPNENKLGYVLSDLQTRLRSQINIVTTKYYELHNSVRNVQDYSVVGKNVDGEKVVLNHDNVMDTLVQRSIQELYTPSYYIEPDIVDIVVKLQKSTSPALLRAFLVYLSERITYQKASKDKSDDLYTVKKMGTSTIYIGIHTLIEQTIRASYKFCIEQKVNTSNRVAVLFALKNVYSSSRVLNQDILNVRDSYGYHIIHSQLSRRESTVSSLKIAAILYVILKTFKYV